MKSRRLEDSATDKVAAAKPARSKPNCTAGRGRENGSAGPESNFSSLTIESGSRNASGNDASSFTLAGRDSRQQLIVTGTLAANGQLRDLTRQVHYSAEPAGIVRIDDVGQVWPRPTERRRSRRSSSGGQKSSIVVKVVRFTNDPPVNFPNQIVPIFTKLGCNAGGCHGKMSGQNGFRLSLLGFVPSEDYEHLVKEGRGRRLSPAAPDSSLLLQKAAGLMPHGGGQRMEVDSVPYKLIAAMDRARDAFWQARRSSGGEHRGDSVDSNAPSRRQQQLICLAHYSDGSVEDVT